LDFLVVTVSAISAAREFESLVDDELDAEFIASPAVANGAIVMRLRTQL